MSSIPTKQIDGDVAVGRNVSAGGDANIQGNARIGHNLIVGGWLDARNIKGPNKGIFRTPEKLREVYPLPHDGWWALVGVTLPAALYIADCGFWVATGESAGNPTLDSEIYNEMVAEMDASIKKVASDVAVNKASIEQIRSLIDSIGAETDTLTSDVEKLKTQLASAEIRITQAQITAGKGVPLSLTLDELDTFGTDGTHTAIRQFVRSAGHTRLRVTESADDSSPIGYLDIFMDNAGHVVTQVFTTHFTLDDDGEIDTSTHICAEAFTYFRTYNIDAPLLQNEKHTWSKWHKLTLALGHASGTAFPGDEGAALQELADGVKIFPYDATCQRTSDMDECPAGTIVFAYDEQLFFVKTGEQKWMHKNEYHTSQNHMVVPRTDCIFRRGNTLEAMRLVEDGESSRYMPEAYVTGSSEFDSIKQRVGDIAILPFSGILSTDADGEHPTEGIWFRTNSDPARGVFDFLGSSDLYGFYDYNTSKSYDGAVFTVAREDRIFRCANDLYKYDGKSLVKIGGAAAGNNYNATVELPLAEGEYYSDIASEAQVHNVLQAVYDAGVAKPGLQITFAIGPGSWKSYQYVGPGVTEEQFVGKPKENWIDLAGMSAGSEPFVNINAVCEDKDYTLSLAVQALLDLTESTGIDYLKEGMVITYRRSSYPFVWETKQYQGALTDLTATNEAQWVDIGNGGGGNVETKDVPEKEGKDALSTGGAYDMQQEAFDHLDIDQDAENHIIKAVNRRGEEMGQSISIPKSSGGGAVSGSSLNIYPENPAVYAAFGSEISVRAAIKSVTFDGQGSNVTETLGVIRRLEIIDTTSGLTLWSESINQNSSTSATDYSFKYDFTPYFSEASSRDFTIVAHDAEGNVRRRTITVTAVDVTCTSVQTLNYSAGSTLEVGGANKNLLMYKFANNVSKLGVRVTTELFFNGEWRKLGEAVITDSYSHSISIDPCNLFGGGEAMEHGSYPVRISGEDVASGVKGNVVYSSVMCIDANSSQPIVSLRYNDMNNGTIRLYDNLEVEIAAYTPGKTSTAAEVIVDGVNVTSAEIGVSQTVIVRKQVQGYNTDGSEAIEFFARSGTSRTNPISIRVVGSAISAVIKEGALFGLDFAGRSNAETDHTISNNGYTLEVYGSNYSSNGFIKYLGENSLRFAENVTGEIPRYMPFGSAATERTNGMALQFAFATNNIKDDEAKLMECYDPDSGAGFYICGNKIVVTCKNGTPSQITRSFRCGEKVTVGVVVEPSTITVRRGSTDYSAIKLYVDGEEIGAIGYVAGSGSVLNQSNIRFNGSDGDLYLYYMLAYDSYYEWAQAFRNYLCKLTDTEAMIAEYDSENVLDNQNRPSMELLKEKGFPYYVVVAPQATFDSFDSDINTKTNFKCTLFYFHPTMPWRSFKAENVRWRRQGTTSAKRPIKNDRFYLKKEKNWKITAINPDYTNADALKTYELFEIGYVRVIENSIPVAILTVKVDYSDSSMANDCGVCDMMNATFRALGNEYITPAQRAFDGTWDKSDVTVTGLQMNHSTANHPIAAFRATNDSLSDAWFHARGNWKEDKGEQVALGFKDTSGYNKGCRNYGDFVEFFGKATFDAAGKFQSQETLTEIMARFKTAEGLDTSKLYLLSQYCGRDYIFMRHSGGEWARCSGSMKQVDGKWQITGDVLNPVSGYELITYDAMDWFMGVGSIDDMMAPVTTQSSWVSKLSLGQATYPAWTQYFECMIDDDQLQEDLAMGRKVPYELFNVLRFCDSCDYSKESLSGTWGKIWRENAWRYMSIQSLITYYAFTDYLAAVDQQAKNMQPMFFLEEGCRVENGEYHSPSAMEPVRMYFNKVYDCDTCNSKDNDGGNTIPADLDPAEDDKCYAGRGSILWNNLRRCENQEMISNAAGGTLTLPGVVGLMRNLPEVDGIGAGPFSPKGALYYFVQKRISFWPKVVCTFDCERKYITYSPLYTDIYYYALHGSGRQSLPRFIEQRWRIRDGYYQTGDFKDNSHVLSGRIGAKPGAVIRFRAAKDGYFGIGNDGGNVTQGMYLKAGEEGVFSQFQHGDNILLYIYQADQMSEIDLSQISIDPNFQFSVMKLAEKIVIGSEDHRESWRLSPGNTGFLTGMQLGDLPFLRHLDVRTTEVTNINASKCPRLETVLASGSDLTSIRIAETSPVVTLDLPAGMTELNLVNLPELSYPGGLAIAGVANVNRLMLSGCPNVDPTMLLNEIMSASKLRYLRLPDVNITAPSSVLRSLKASGVIGLDSTGNAYEESNQCSGMSGRWIMEDFIDDTTLGEFRRYFPQLEILNSQFSTLILSDDAADPENISNPENHTGYLYSSEDRYVPYIPGGHIIKIRDTAPVCMALYDALTRKMAAYPLAADTLLKYADGSVFDPADTTGKGYDVMKYIPRYWYKGVNHYTASEKRLFVSANEEKPLSTASVVMRFSSSDLLFQRDAALLISSQEIGREPAIGNFSTSNVCRADVSGMRLIRWPGVHSAQIAAVFTGADGKVISVFSFFNNLCDMLAGDYLITEVPKGAVHAWLTVYKGFDDVEVIITDSDNIESVEPDWLLHEPELIGVYHGHCDAARQLRSISDVVCTHGDGTSGTNPDWEYDSNGNLTSVMSPMSTMHWTAKDFSNAAAVRGKGYQLQDYESWKDFSVMILAITGTRDLQGKCGMGSGGDGRVTTGGYNTENPNGFSVYPSAGGNPPKGNLLWGLQNYMGCGGEFLDNCAVNIESWKLFKRNRCNELPTDPVDYKWHIYNPVTNEERVIQGDGSAPGYCIGKIRWGRRCDIVCSRTTGDNSKWNQHFTDSYHFGSSKGRVVLRAHAYSNAHAGLFHVNTNYNSAYSVIHWGARLAFRGEITLMT